MSISLVLIDLFGFNIPANEMELNIVYLYSEIFFMGFVILYIILECLCIIEERYTYTNTVYAVSFTSRMEDFLEIFFLYFSLFIVLYILIPSLGFLYTSEYSLDSYDYSFTLEVTGHQWYWSYRYALPAYDTLSETLLSDYWNSSVSDVESFDSIMVDSLNKRLLEVDRCLVIPSNTNIFTMITSADVLHSWSVPQLGIKVDAIPGRVSCICLYTITTGLWLGQCSELCGYNHAFMPIIIKSIDPELFFTWRMQIVDPIVDPIDSIEDSTIQAFSIEVPDTNTKVSCQTNKNIQIDIPKSAQESLSQRSFVGEFFDSVDLTAAEIFHDNLKAEEKKTAYYSWFVYLLRYLRDLGVGIAVLDLLVDFCFHPLYHPSYCFVPKITWPDFLYPKINIIPTHSIETAQYINRFRISVSESAIGVDTDVIVTVNTEISKADFFTLINKCCWELHHTKNGFRISPESQSILKILVHYPVLIDYLAEYTRSDDSNRHIYLHQSRYKHVKWK